MTNLSVQVQIYFDHFLDVYIPQYQQSKYQFKKKILFILIYILL
jgi:hypothetical protein